MVNPASALAYITSLLSLLEKKRLANDALIAELKNKATVINGVPYMPTGFSGKNLEELLGELNNAYGIDNASGINTQADSQNDTGVGISVIESETEVTTVEITDCSTAVDDVFPKYTESEIKKVFEETVIECETRNNISELLKGVDLTEAINAKCDITEPDIPQPAIFLNPSDIADIVADVKEPADSSKKSRKTLITLTSVAAAGGAEVKKLKNVGDTVICGEPILQVGAKTVNSPVANGVIKEFYVGATAKSGDKLFLIEEPQLSDKDNLQAVLDVSNSATAEINKAPKLKEDIGKIEPKVWINKIIYAVYDGQYQGFTQPDIVSVQAKEEILEKPLKDLLKELSNIILPFANNVTLDNVELAAWGNENYNINQTNAISYADLDKNPLEFKHKDGVTVWAGIIKNLREDLVDKALALSKITDVIELEKASDELKIKERNLLGDIEKLANETYAQAFQSGLKIGYYYRLNPGSIISNLITSDVETLLKTNLDRAKKNFEDLYTEYLSIKSQIAAIEKTIDDLPGVLTNIANNSCVLKDGSSPTAALINGESINVISWPITDQDLAALPKDDDNFKGNSSKNTPAVTDLRYWKKYCLNATLVNLLPTYWPIGLLIPTPSGLVKIPLPIIWKPFVVIPTPFCVIVIGLALCGICPAPFVYLVNPGWPFPIGIVNTGESYFLTGIRGPAKIDAKIAVKVLDAIPTIITPLVYKKDDINIQKPIVIDVAPEITKSLPLIKDDLPAFERLSITNLPYALYLTKWCAAGKKTMGFFENP
jgi:hypothetical protein